MSVNISNFMFIDGIPSFAACKQINKKWVFYSLFSLLLSFPVVCTALWGLKYFVCVGEVLTQTHRLSDWDAALRAHEGCSGSSTLTNQSARPPHWRHRLIHLILYLFWSILMCSPHALLRSERRTGRRTTVRFCQQTTPSLLSCYFDLGPLTVRKLVPVDNFNL